MAEKLVYSTGVDMRKSGQAPAKKAAVACGPCKMRLETKGRGGKAVTVLFNLSFGGNEARELMKEVQNLAGCGGTLKNNTIELQGDVRLKVEQCFAARGLKIVRAGG